MPQLEPEWVRKCNLKKGDRLRKVNSNGATRYELIAEKKALGMIWRTSEGFASEWGRRDHRTPEDAIQELKQRRQHDQAPRQQYSSSTARSRQAR